jgi:toxin ParE1/3/4
MAATIVYSKTARIDLQEIFAFISKNSLRFAQKEVHEICEKIKILKSNTYLGHQFYESGDELTREMVYKNYRIIYSISLNQQQIQILTIHHHARFLANNPAINDEE